MKIELYPILENWSAKIYRGLVKILVNNDVICSPIYQPGELELS